MHRRFRLLTMGTVALLVGRNSVQHGGKPIKWLGDGVMLHFGDPGRGVRRRGSGRMLGWLGRARWPG